MPSLQKTKINFKHHQQIMYSLLIIQLALSSPSRMLVALFLNQVTPNRPSPGFNKPILDYLKQTQALKSSPRPS